MPYENFEAAKRRAEGKSKEKFRIFLEGSIFGMRACGASFGKMSEITGIPESSVRALYKRAVETGDKLQLKSREEN